MVVVKITGSGNGVIFIGGGGEMYMTSKKFLSGFLGRGKPHDLLFLSRMGTRNGLMVDGSFSCKNVIDLSGGDKVSVEEYFDRYGFDKSVIDRNGLSTGEDKDKLFEERYGSL